MTESPARDSLFPTDGPEFLRDWENRPVGLALPAPLSHRLDALVELAESAGQNTNRRELVAALILAATESPGELARLVERYRTAPSTSVVVGDMEESRFLGSRRAKSGPR